MSDIFVWFFTLVTILLMIVNAITIIRNEKVLRYRRNLIWRTESLEDLKLIDNVNYFRMVYMFWKSFDSFYPRDFIERLNRPKSEF